MTALIGIFLLYFFSALIIAIFPCIIQFLFCIYSGKLRIRLLPVALSSLAMAFWAVLIFTEHFPLELFGYSKYWFQWCSMLAALAVAHGLPFLSLGHKK